MAQTNQAAEPSMEDILASIRRIISEDDNSVAEPETANIANANIAESGASEQFETTENPLQNQAATEVELGVDEAAAAEFEAGLEAANFGADESAEDLEPLELNEPLELTDAMEVTTSLMSAEAEEVEPTEIVLDDFSEVPPFDVYQASSEEEAAGEIAMPLVLEDAIEQPVVSSGLLDRTTDMAVAATFKELEQALAAEQKSLPEMTDLVLRPLIKDWLDDNLPQMVERLVREEIQRVARG